MSTMFDPGKSRSCLRPSMLGCASTFETVPIVRESIPVAGPALTRKGLTLLFPRGAFVGLSVVFLLAWGSAAFAFAVGNRVQANGVVNVRSTPAGTVLGTQASGSQGTIIGGPQTASLSGTSYTWWNVNWDTGFDGWVADIGLTLVPAAPTTSSVVPNSYPASGSNQTMTINGSNFQSGDTLTFIPPEGGTIGSTAAKLTFVSSTQLSYQFNNSNDVGTWSVRVNSPDGTQHSSYVNFTVVANTPTPTPTTVVAAPTISSVVPNSYPASGSNQTMAINGSNFQSGDTLTFIPPEGGTIGSTAAKLTFVSSTQLSYQFNNSNDVGTWSVRVNSPDGTQHSSYVNFTVVANTPTPTPTTVVAAPTISSVVPNSYPASGSNQTMAINGSNFQSGDTLTFIPPEGGTIGSTAAKLTFVSSTQLSYQFNNSNDVGTWSVRVNSPDGTQHSSYVNFTVVANTPTPTPTTVVAAPTISSVVPNSYPASGSNQTMTINGSNFQSGDTLTFIPPEGGTIGSTAAKLTFVSSTQLSYQFNNSNDVGTWSVRVNSPDGTQHSSYVNFTVVANTPTPTPTTVVAAPTISSVVPNSYPASGSNQTMTINGSNFQSGDTLTFIPPEGGTIGSTAAKLTFVSSTQLSYQFNNSNDVGTWSVRVNSPDGTQHSSYVNFTVVANTPTPTPTTVVAAPTISSVVPNSYPASGSNQTMAINGSNFQSGDTLTFIPPEGGTIGSTAAKLTFVSSTQLSYQFNNSNDVGTWSVRVNSPDGTQHSSYLSFTVVMNTPTPTPTSPLGQTPFLTSPLADYSPYNAPIVSVFDHSVNDANVARIPNSLEYAMDGMVTAYNNESGSNLYPVGGGNCYEQASGAPFIINGNYTGDATSPAPADAYLCYDGHPGYDYRVGTGTNVLAAADGTVLCAGCNSPTGPTCPCTGHDTSSACTTLGGYFVRVDHHNGYYTEYLHLSEIDVACGEAVNQGEPIAASGASGAVTGPHLHFQVRTSDGAFSVDPYGWHGSDVLWITGAPTATPTATSPPGGCPQTNLGSTLPVSVSGSTAGRANALSGASCGGGGGAPDYAYQWAAPSAGTYTIDTFGSSFDTVLYVRNASCGGTELACNDDAGGTNQSQVAVTLAAGQTIVIVVDGYGAASGNYSLHITGGAAASPTPTRTPTTTPTPGGSCPQTNLGSTLPVSVSGSTAGRANALSGASCGGGGGAPDYAYQWAAPSAGTYTIDTFGSSFDTVLYVRNASCGGTELACNDDAGGTNQSQVAVTLAAGQTIVIVVDGYGAASGNYSLHITGGAAASPTPTRTPTTTPTPGGSCPQTNLGSTLPVSVSGSTAGRANALSGASCGGGGGAPDYAYQWAAPSAGTYTIDTFGSSFDTVLYVRNASCGGTELACNDDAGGTNQSQVAVTLAAGQTIVIVVDGYGAASGNYSLHITGGAAASPTPTRTPTTTPTPGGSCPQTNLGSTLPVSVSGSTAGRANALSGASCGGGGGAPDYAYQWAAPSAGTYTIDTFGSSFDTVLYVRNASCGGTELACNDDAGGTNQSQVAVTLAAGQTIVIVVDGYGAASGNYSLHITGGAAASPTPTRTPTATPTAGGSCPQTNLGSVLPVSVSGSTAGRANALSGASCGAGGTGPDFAYQWTAPSAGTYTIDTMGSNFDTVLYVRAASCGGAELACNDDTAGGSQQSQVAVTLAAGQTIVIVVDGYGPASGSYNLHLAPFASGAPACALPGCAVLNDKAAFDQKCVSNPTTMQTWWNDPDNPFVATGVYLGGKNVSCYPSYLGTSCNNGDYRIKALRNTYLNSSWITTVRSQGWSIMPLWVGYQSPCYYPAETCSTPGYWWMGYDLNCNPADPYTQGTQEAQEAVCAANILGINSSIIYYDIEGYPTAGPPVPSACSAAVSAFINGWVSTLHAHGFLAGVYGDDWNIRDFGPSAAPNPPDAVWFKAWDNSPSVWDTNVSDTWPPAERRIHQYCNYPNDYPTRQCSANPLGLTQFDLNIVEAPVLPGQ